MACFHLDYLIGLAEDHAGDVVDRLLDLPEVTLEAYIQPLGAYLVEVSGESECQALLEGICGGRKRSGVHYRMQPTLVIYGNEVRVVVDGGFVGRLDDAYAIGYRDQLATTPYFRATVWCEAMIVGGWDRGDGDRGNFGVKLDLPPNVLALDIIEGGPMWPNGSPITPRGGASE